MYQLLRAFTKLNDSERSQFLTEVAKFQSAPYYDKERLKNNINERAGVGPKDSICSCCGR